jgi:hypothetical protein
MATATGLFDCLPRQDRAAVALVFRPGLSAGPTVAASKAMQPRLSPGWDP